MVMKFLKQTGNCIKEHLLNEHQKLYRIVSDEFIIFRFNSETVDDANLSYINCIRDSTTCFC